MRTLDPAVFDDAVQLVRMGDLQDSTLHLRFAGERFTDSIALTSEEARLLHELDPTSFTHRYRPGERMSLLDMAARGMLRIILPGSGIAAYDWSLHVAEPVHIVQDPFDPGFICLTGSTSFNLVELGRPLLQRVDGTRTVAEITEEYQNDVLSGPNGRQVLASALEKNKRPFYLLLCDAGMSLTKGLLESGAGTCLPTRVPA